MNKMFLVSILGGLSIVAFAQAPKPTVADEPKLSYTETIASKSVAQDINTVTTEVQSFQADIAKAHPGFFYNFQTGQLAKVPVASKPEAPKEAPALKK